MPCRLLDVDGGGNWEWEPNTKTEVAPLVSPYLVISPFDVYVHCVNLLPRFSAASIIY